jgi:hypothetical protein
MSQIHMAWFDYRHTIRIKVDAFHTKRQMHHLSVWFEFKRKRNAKVIRRLVRWAKQ